MFGVERASGSEGKSRGSEEHASPSGLFTSAPPSSDHTASSPGTDFMYSRVVWLLWLLLMVFWCPEHRLTYTTRSAWALIIIHPEV
jgi:hypothetical protein